MGLLLLKRNPKTIMFVYLGNVKGVGAMVGVDEWVSLRAKEILEWQIGQWLREYQTILCDE